MTTKSMAVLAALMLTASPGWCQSEQIEWAKIADGMVTSLIDNFWGASFKERPNRYYFNKMSRQADLGTGDYWPQAHSMDVIVDAYMRTHDAKYLKIFDQWWEGAPKHNFSGRREDPWWNVFVDDMEWFVLAQIRMYEATGRTLYLNKARQMYADWIWTQWDEEYTEPFHGGITWKTDVQRSKNACSNGPAALIAARLAQFADVDRQNDRKTREEYLSEATRIVSWMMRYLYNPRNGAIYDAMHEGGRIANFSLTYNQGTFLGACHELFKLTGNKQYLKEAVNASNYVIDHMSGNRGVLGDATGGDGGLFHGIFFRYFVRLIKEPALDDATRQRFSDYLTRLATVMVKEGLNHETMIYGGRWRNPQPADRPSALTPQLSGCMLVEAMCLLNK